MVVKRGRREPEPANLEKTPELNEVALIGEGRDITRGYLGPLLENRDTVLSSRGGSDLKIYYELLRDDQVFSCWQQRQMGFIDHEVEVLPGLRRFGEPTEADLKAVDFVKELINAIPFDSICRRMHYGVFFGYGVGEIMYAVEDGWTILDDACGGVKVRRPERFRFDDQGRLRLLTFSDMWLGELLRPDKFWVFSAGGNSDDDPYGLGIAHQLYWPVYLKRKGMLAWVNRLRKIIPTPVATYPNGASTEEKNKALMAAESVGDVEGLAKPEGTVMAILEATKGGTADNEQFTNQMNAAIAKIILSQTMTTDAAGGQYKGDIQMEVRQEITKSDSDLLCQSFMQCVLTPLIEYNQAKLGDAVVPQVWRRMVESEDLDKESATWQRLWQMGYEPDLEALNSKFDGNWVKREMSGVQPMNLSDRLPLPEFAERPAAGQTIDAYAKQVQEEIAPGLEQWIERIAQELNASATLEDFAERLIAVYPDLPSEMVTDALERGLVAARLAGWYEAQEKLG